MSSADQVEERATVDEIVFDEIERLKLENIRLKEERLQEEGRKLAAQQQAVVAVIEQRLGVDLRKYAINLETGRGRLINGAGA